MKCRHKECEGKEMNKQPIQKKVMISYDICNSCLEHRIKFRRRRYLKAWLRFYPSEVLKHGFKYNPVTEENIIVYFKLTSIKE